MAGRLIAACAAAAGLTLQGCQAPHVGDGGVLYYGFTRVDPIEERVVKNAWVVVRDGKIERTGAGAPPTRRYQTRRDFSGRYATPGLIDTHAHLTLGPVAIDRSGPAPALKVEYRDDITEHNARLLLGYGVTTVRNPGGDAAINTAYRDAAAAGRILGPEARVAGPVIDRTPIAFHGLIDAVEAARPIEMIVAEQAAAGVDDIKLYFSLTEEDVAKGVAAAHRLNKRAIGHLGISWKKAADYGIDAIVHAIPASADDLEPAAREAYRKAARPGAFAFFEWWEHADLDGEAMTALIRTLAEKKVHVDLTLIAFHLAFWGDDEALREKYVALAHPAMIENWRSLFRFDIGWQADDYRRAKAVWPKIEKFARALYDAGVPLTLGTDQSNPFVAPGASLVEEMELHAEAGIPRWAILRMATSDAAEILGFGEKTGRIAPRLDADIVFLRRNPVEDFSAFHDAEYVLANGNLHEAETLKAR